jgi:hypothetical protein
MNNKFKWNFFNKRMHGLIRFWINKFNGICVNPCNLWLKKYE